MRRRKRKKKRRQKEERKKKMVVISQVEESELRSESLGDSALDTKGRERLKAE